MTTETKDLSPETLEKLRERLERLTADAVALRALVERYVAQEKART